MVEDTVVIRYYNGTVQPFYGTSSVYQYATVLCWCADDATANSTTVTHPAIAEVVALKPVGADNVRLDECIDIRQREISVNGAAAEPRPGTPAAEPRPETPAAEPRPGTPAAADDSDDDDRSHFWDCLNNCLRRVP